MRMHRLQFALSVLFVWVQELQNMQGLTRFRVDTDHAAASALHAGWDSMAVQVWFSLISVGCLVVQCKVKMMPRVGLLGVQPSGRHNPGRLVVRSRNKSL